MGLSVNGLKVKEGMESKLSEIKEIIQPVIASSMQERAKKEFFEIYLSFLKALNKKVTNESSFDFGDFFKKSIFLYVKEEEMPTLYFEKPINKSAFPVFIRDLYSSEFLSYNSFKLKFLPTKSSNKVLLILPFDMDLTFLPQEIFNYCDIYSATNNTDDIPSHFNSEEENNQAINDWYDVDDGKLFLSFDIEVDLPVEEWIEDIKVIDIYPKIGIYERVFREFYLEKDSEVDVLDMIDEIIKLKKDPEFKRLSNEKLIKEIAPLEKIHASFIEENQKLLKKFKN